MDEQNLAQVVIDEETAARLAELFRTLGDPSRIRIISVLSYSASSVGSIAEAVGISESAVSHHLRGLRQMRLVRARKAGRQVFYSLDDEHIADLFRRSLDHVLHG
jgi:DNA-binding transcriptional ArsR family regulator